MLSPGSRRLPLFEVGKERPISPTLLHIIGQHLTGQIEPGRQAVRQPTLAFLLSLLGGTAMVSFSSGLTSYAQYYFITNILVQNTFIIGVLTVFVGALLYQRPHEHIVWSAIMVTMAIDELVLVESISSAIPLLQISALGPVAGALALLSGILGLRFKSA